MPLTRLFSPLWSAAASAPSRPTARISRMDTVESCLHLPLHP
mgnify:CR=1 FL=1